MDSTEHVKYSKSTFPPVKSKSDYYFVVCTKPIEPRKTKSDKAAIRTTKIRDYHETTRLWDKIEVEIYNKSDAALKRHPSLELAEIYWDKFHTDYLLKKFLSSLKAENILLEIDHNREVNKYLADLYNDDGAGKIPEYLYSD